LETLVGSGGAMGLVTLFFLDMNMPMQRPRDSGQVMQTQNGTMTVTTLIKAKAS